MAGEGKRKTLQDYAREHPRTPKNRCWLCSIPERRTVEQGMRDGIPLATIREWLVNECGYTARVATDDRLRHHKDRDHADN